MLFLPQVDQLQPLGLMELSPDADCGGPCLIQQVLADEHTDQLAYACPAELTGTSPFTHEVQRPIPQLRPLSGSFSDMPQVKVILVKRPLLEHPRCTATASSLRPPASSRSASRSRKSPAQGLEGSLASPLRAHSSAS
jgi:hypothetical protein